MKTSLMSVAAVFALAVTGTTVQAQDAENGQDLFRQCRACHQIGAGAKNLVGPQLNGVIGRKAGSVEGFSYSDANKKTGADGLVWDDEKFLKYIENPLAFMPGTKMAYAGLKDEGDRKDILAYLKKASAK